MSSLNNGAPRTVLTHTGSVGGRTGGAARFAPHRPRDRQETAALSAMRGASPCRALGTRNGSRTSHCRQGRGGLEQEKLLKNLHPDWGDRNPVRMDPGFAGCSQSTAMSILQSQPTLRRICGSGREPVRVQKGQGQEKDSRNQA